MSQILYGGPLDDWYSRRITIRDGIVCVDVMMKGKIDRIETTIALTPPAAPDPEASPDPPAATGPAPLPESTPPRERRRRRRRA